jgi:hypothetical protein
MADNRAPCCKVEANLKLQSADHPEVACRPGFSLRICKGIRDGQVCNRRHFELNAEAGIIGMKGARIG